MGGPVVITYLELPAQAPVRPPSRPAPEGFATREVHDPAVNRDLYARVGGDYQWFDRLVWSDERWAEHATSVETHVVELDGRIAGYWEIELDAADSAKIGLFGLLGEFHGIGLGGHALDGRADPRPRAAPAHLAHDLHARRPVRAGELPRPRDAAVPHRDPSRSRSIRAAVHRAAGGQSLPARESPAEHRGPW